MVLRSNFVCTTVDVVHGSSESFLSGGVAPVARVAQPIFVWVLFVGMTSVATTIDFVLTVQETIPLLFQPS